MSFQSFLLQLSGLGLITALLLFGMHQVWPSLQEHQMLSWISLGLYFILSLIMFYAGKSTAQSENKNMFTAVVLGFVFGKMALSLMIVVVYTQDMAPTSKYFILPFFLTYLLFTIYETYFLIKLGKQKVPEKI